eukprot:gene691-749_t
MKIIVKNSAPNWPAMVEKQPSKDQLRRIEPEKQCRITSAAASLWMQSRQMKNSIDRDYSRSASTSSFTSSYSSSTLSRSSSSCSTKSMTKFASKTQLVRQCQHCQVLYTNFHSCQAND